MINNPRFRLSQATSSPHPIVSEALKAKREKLLLARTAPVENSDEKPDILPMPIHPNSSESIEIKRKRMTVSKSECSPNTSNFPKKTNQQWKSMDNFNNNGEEDISMMCLPTRTSRRLSEKIKTNKKNVKFGGINVYYFGRSQSYSTIPSSPGVSLGMENKHHSSKIYSFYDFARATTRENEKKWAAIRKKLQEQKKPRRSPRKKPTAIKSIMSHTVENEITKSVHEVLTSLVDWVVEDIKAEFYNSDTEMKAVGEEESESDEDDEVFPIPEAEILQPLETNIRHFMLEQSSVPLDLTDDSDCQEIRQSRTKCGCSCLNGMCNPENCECAVNGIKCQVDSQGFPCVCAKESCSNPEGRVEFNPLRVRSHYLTTIKILKDSEKMGYEHTSSHPRHIKFVESDEENGTETSYCSTPPPPIYQTQTTVQLTTDMSCSSSSTIATVNTSTGSVVIAQCVNNNGTLLNDNILSQNEISASSMETPPQQNQEANGISKRKYPVTPTYKRENVVYEFAEDTSLERQQPLFPSCPSLMGPSVAGLRRSPRNSPMKRPCPPPSMTSVVVVGNVDTPPAIKRPKKVPSARSIIVNFSQTIDEENFPFEALEQPESSKYEGNGT